MFNQGGADLLIPAALCDTHNYVSGQLVRDALNIVWGEVEDHLTDLLQGVHPHQQSPLPQQLQDFIEEAQAFLAAVKPADEFQYFYDRKPPGNWAYC